MQKSTSVRGVVRDIDGLPLARDEVLKTGRRWTCARKANLVLAINGGLISVEEAVKTHSFSVDEIAEMRARYAADGLDGLKVTKIQKLSRSSEVAPSVAR